MIPPPLSTADGDSSDDGTDVAPQATSVSTQCSSCGRRTISLSNGRAWCQICRAFSDDPNGGSWLIRVSFVAAALLLAVALFYVQGVLDQYTYAVGLNWQACGHGLAQGEIVCGEESSVHALTDPESLKVGIKSWFW